jgi:hypothetical protein
MEMSYPVNNFQTHKVVIKLKENRLYNHGNHTTQVECRQQVITDTFPTFHQAQQFRDATVQDVLTNYPHIRIVSVDVKCIGERASRFTYHMG